MTITIRFWRRNRDWEPDYSKKIITQITGENAADCMKQIYLFRQKQDLAKFTRAEIICVED